MYLSYFKLKYICVYYGVSDKAGYQEEKAYRTCPISPVSKKLSLSDMYANTGNYVMR